jgi:hypothetical protein
MTLGPEGAAANALEEFNLRVRPHVFCSIAPGIEDVYLQPLVPIPASN